MWNGVREYVRTSRIAKFLSHSLTVDNVIKISGPSLAAVVAILFTAINPTITISITVAAAFLPALDHLLRMSTKKDLVRSRQRALLPYRESPFFIIGLTELGVFSISAICLAGYSWIVATDATIASSVSSASIIPDTANLVTSYICVFIASILPPITRMSINFYIKGKIKELDQEILTRIQAGRIAELNLAELANINFSAIHLAELRVRTDSELVAEQSLCQDIGDRFVASSGEAERLTGERDRIRGERDTARADLARVQTRVTQLQEERDTIREEMDRLGTDLAAARTEIQGMFEELDTARRALAAEQAISSALQRQIYARRAIIDYRGGHNVMFFRQRPAHQEDITRPTRSTGHGHPLK